MKGLGKWRRCIRARCRITCEVVRKIADTAPQPGPQEGVVYLFSRIGEAGLTNGRTMYILYIDEFSAWFEVELFDPVIPQCDRVGKNRRPKE